MAQDKIQKALRLTIAILDSDDLTDNTRENLINVKLELEMLSQQKDDTIEQFKKILTKLFELALNYLPAVIEIIDKWMQDKQ
jgi:hypothetical protein